MLPPVPPPRLGHALRPRGHTGRRRRPRFPKSIHAFQSRLAWRDHFAQKLEDQPSIETTCLDPATESLRDTDPARLDAWAKGETGLPFVDACIRSLIATGWLNFRMRAMVMATASYHLWLDWRASGPILARRFTDYDPGIHWPQVQMQSGTTAINTIRIYNPVKQGHDQDPTGAFTRAGSPNSATFPTRSSRNPGAGTVPPACATRPPSSIPPPPPAPHATGSGPSAAPPAMPKPPPPSSPATPAAPTARAALSTTAPPANAPPTPAN